MTDEVQVDAQQVSNGVAQWEAASSALAVAWQRARVEVAGLSDAGTWGADGVGDAFASSYLASGGPQAVLFSKGGAEGVLGQAAELGPRVAKAVGLSLAADEEQAAEMLIPPVGGV